MSLDFIIIGAQKSATSFVHDCLREHPSIHMSPEEIPFFESPDYENGGSEWLRTDLSNPPGTLFGIKRPSYLSKSDVPGRIYAHCPDAKLIVILRNPIDRALSAYFHYIRNRFLPFTSLVSGMEKIFAGSTLAMYPAAQDILEYGFYAKHLRSYLKRFSKARICILLHDDIVADGKAAMRRVYRFLGVDENYAPRSMDTRPQAVLYQPLRLWLAILVNRLEFRHSVFRQRVIAKKNAPISHLVARALKLVDKKILAPVFKNPRPEIPESLRQRLGELYLKDLEDLELLLERDLSSWRVSPTGAFSKVHLRSPRGAETTLPSRFSKRSTPANSFGAI